jgi:signal transduction histidine kinase
MVVLPLSRLNERAKRIAQGDLTGSIEKEGQDEVRRLAESFETIRSRLETSQRELAEWSTELEKRVKQRTGQLEQRDKERDVLLNKVISAQEDERTRIARDLHDQIGQTLTGLVMQIGGAQARLANDPETVKEQLITLGESASGAVEEVRRMMSDLRPSILDDMGLESAVGWYTETHLERQGITVVLDLQREKVPLSPNVEISAFRVCQEAITNVIKHANAKRVHISLDYNNGSLNGTIQDDGSGFELSTTQPGADGGWAVGILGMTERVNLLGGSLTIESNPDSGTAVKFEIPLGGTAQDE